MAEMLSFVFKDFSLSFKANLIWKRNQRERSKLLTELQISEVRAARQFDLLGKQSKLIQNKILPIIAL